MEVSAQIIPKIYCVCVAVVTVVAMLKNRTEKERKSKQCFCSRNNVSVGCFRLFAGLQVYKLQVDGAQEMPQSDQASM